MQKHNSQVCGFSLLKKAASSRKNLKKIPCSLFGQIRSSKRCTEFFKEINRSRDIKVLVILRFRRIVLHNILNNRTRTTNNQENSAHSFGENYLTDHLVNFL